MGILANSKEKRQQRFEREFISLFDSIVYLGEPLDESLKYIIECMPYQSKLYLTNDGCQTVTIYNNSYDSDGEVYFLECTWRFDNNGFFAKALTTNEIINSLTECVKQNQIEPTNMIYNLGFGRKRFLEYLQNDGIEINQSDLLTAQSPTPICDEYVDIDYYTLQSIIDERDELRGRVDELKKQGTPKVIKPQGDDLLILGAVIETLANVKVNPYTQAKLIIEIMARHNAITGLSESTLTKKFAESKKYLQQKQ
ncbi:hypothetical protein LP117_03105 [Moraxella bovis]|uniref:hypothetical protein n=2 Tax=Moraxella bovis TaxID=476 RepID=UPI002227D369|nr:hypothetical protein [Moraxella bovis]UZA25466.1 hypothetical protein LP117_03105 [Moraxella bovis]UZA29040.1 hypothetical protein LP097_08740 [Moraxella bovis]